MSPWAGDGGGDGIIIRKLGITYSGHHWKVAVLMQAFVKTHPTNICMPYGTQIISKLNLFITLAIILKASPQLSLYSSCLHVFSFCHLVAVQERITRTSKFKMEAPK